MLSVSKYLYKNLEIIFHVRYLMFHDTFSDIYIFCIENLN